MKADERSSLKGKSGRAEEKLTQEAKESVGQSMMNNDSDESGGAKCLKTKFAKILKDY